MDGFVPSPRCPLTHPLPCCAYLDLRLQIYFKHGDVYDARTLDPFTHIYMFDIGFPPKVRTLPQTFPSDPLQALGA